MPQLQPGPWFSLFFLSTIQLFIFMPMKISKHNLLTIPSQKMNYNFINPGFWPICKKWNPQQQQQQQQWQW